MPSVAGSLAALFAIQFAILGLTVYLRCTSSTCSATAPRSRGS